MSLSDRQVLTADGNTNTKIFAGPLRLSLTGSFGGGTAKLQVRDLSGAFIDITNGLFTAATDTLFDFPVGSKNELRVNIAGSTTPALVVWLQGNQIGG